MLITFSGLDGAGKSTLIEGLRASLERDGHAVAVLHMNDNVGVYAYARAARNWLLRLLGREAPEQLPPGSDPLDPARPVNRTRLRRAIRRVRYAILWSQTVRRCIYPIDLLIFTLYRLAFEKLTKRVFIMDRYFYDTLVDLSESGPSLWNRVLAWITLTPDVPVLLEVAPERAFGRKGEYTIEYLQRRWTAYQTVLGWVPECVKLANVDLTQTQAALYRVVMARMPGGGIHSVTGFDQANERPL